jgi:hypothetical protein
LFCFDAVAVCLYYDSTPRRQGLFYVREGGCSLTERAAKGSGIAVWLRCIVGFMRSRNGYRSMMVNGFVQELRIRAMQTVRNTACSRCPTSILILSKAVTTALQTHATSPVRRGRVAGSVSFQVRGSRYSLGAAAGFHTTIFCLQSTVGISTRGSLEWTSVLSPRTGPCRSLIPCSKGRVAERLRLEDRQRHYVYNGRSPFLLVAGGGWAANRLYRVK